MDKMSMSLDDIISMNKASGDSKNSNNRGGGGGGKMRRSRGQGQGQGHHQRSSPYAGASGGYGVRAQELALRRLMRRQGQGQGQGQASSVSRAPTLASNKILVSNLADTVSESDVMELFEEFGRIRYAALHHDAAGNSLGTADVIFDNNSAAASAVRQYHGVQLDGRSMTIQLAVTEIAAPAQNSHVANRLGDLAMNNNNNYLPDEVSDLEGFGRGGRGRSRGSNSSLPGTFKPRGNSGGGSVGGFKRDREAVPSQDELDREMEAYNKERQRLKERMDEG